MSEHVQRSLLSAARRLTVDELLRRAVRKYPDATAMRCGASSLTFAELEERTRRVVSGLAELGVGTGDRVAIVMRNRVEFAETFFGAVTLGAVAVAVNFRLSPDEIAYVLADSGAKVVVTELAYEQSVATALDNEALEVRVITVDGTGARSGALAEAGFQDWPLADAAPSALITERDPACVLYTSGTTGRPKGAVLTHGGLAVQASERAAAQHLRPVGEVWLSGLQLFHVAGLTALLAAITIGGEFITLDHGGVTAGELADLLENHQVTTCSLVPNQLQDLVEIPDLTHRRFALERVSWGSSPAAGPILDRLRNAFSDLELMTVYGQTESGGISTALTGPDAAAHPGSIGRPLPLVEIRVAGEDLAELPTGGVGELLLRGPCVMTGYWNQPDATAAAFEDGWLHTGDMGYVDAEGLYWVVDRRKEMIISGGENIYPAELERVIAQHPKVEQVAVVGVPHTRWGETPVAVVVPVDQHDPPRHKDIIEHTRAQLASYKKPTETVVVPALPRGATGKVQKFRIRESLMTHDRG